MDLELDCDDSDITINPGAADLDNDEIDQDCDGADYVDGLCDNSCQYANDGECDDGGPFSDYDYCGFGTDCADCGPRDDLDGDGQYDSEGESNAFALDCNDNDNTIYNGAPEVEGDGIDRDCDGVDLRSSALCDDSCQYANDGADDGGMNSAFDLCDLGTDCSDCGGFDTDEDGYDSEMDCNDVDPAINPGVSTDDYVDGVDNDCDGRD